MIAIMLTIIMLCVVTLNVIMLCRYAVSICSVVMINVVMMNVFYAECCYAVCCYAQCHSAVSNKKTFITIISISTNILMCLCTNVLNAIATINVVLSTLFKNLALSCFALYEFLLLTEER
jgi:hypothetical protein